MKPFKNKKLWAPAGALLLGVAAFAGFFYYKGRFGVGFAERGFESKTGFAERGPQSKSGIVFKAVKGLAKEIRRGLTNVEGRDLRGIVLTGERIQDGNFKRVDMRGAKINKTSFYNTDFSDANLQNVRGQNARWFMSDLQRADFRKAGLQGSRIASDLRGANFGEAQLQRSQIGADLKNPDGFMDQTDFRKAKFHGARFNVKADALKKARWEGAVYNRYTKFPPGFDPKAFGMIQRR